MHSNSGSASLSKRKFEAVLQPRHPLTCIQQHQLGELRFAALKHLQILAVMSRRRLLFSFCLVQPLEVIELFHLVFAQTHSFISSILLVNAVQFPFNIGYCLSVVVRLVPTSECTFCPPPIHGAFSCNHRSSPKGRPDESCEASLEVKQVCNLWPSFRNTTV
jgi:hypothetical protein